MSNGHPLLSAKCSPSEDLIRFKNDFQHVFSDLRLLLLLVHIPVPRVDLVSLRVYRVTRYLFVVILAGQMRDIRSKTLYLR